ncbi:hypothetical protein PG991_013062 [Apiospora marii]|uniref:Uncharacterized protein n=1 Tax=Apiospora marii TaxID=335849 RepID=A0ABR1R5U7_9PEZI
MEPLAALGTAAAVVLFVDFGTAIIRESPAGRGDGKSLTHSDFVIAVKDLISLSQSLKNKSPTVLLRKHEAVSDILSASSELLRNCSAVAEELTQVLESLRPSRMPKPSRRANFHATPRTVWNADRIRDLLLLKLLSKGN